MHHNIQLDLEINFSSRWHAGSGEGSFSTDRLVRRGTRNQPFIPASTLKGIVRQNCEKVSRTLGFPDPSDPHQVDLNQNQAFVPLKQVNSPIDLIFGTKFEPGGLFFRDARPRNDTDYFESFTRNRTARYRILKTVRDKHLFSSEYIPEGIVLFTRIDGWHNNLVSIDDSYPPFAYCFLIAGILSVERIGGDKSTGAGHLYGPIRIKYAAYNQKPVNLEEVIDFELLTYQNYLEMKGVI
ncbi:MAG: RAMP superfamily CRISPR-associated protein [Thermodesulfobacteriota bacterium]